MHGLATIRALNEARTYQYLADRLRELLYSTGIRDRLGGSCARVEHVLNRIIRGPLGCDADGLQRALHNLRQGVRRRNRR